MNSLITVAVYQFVSEAELMQTLLEEQGIPAYLADDNLIAMDWLMSAAVGGVKLQVAAEDVDRAQQWIEANQSRRRAGADPEHPQATLSFHCENCRQLIEFPAYRRGGVETCPLCHRYVDVPE